MSNNDINLIFINIRYGRPLRTPSLSNTMTIYDAKKNILHFFAKKIKHTITDFQLVETGYSDDIDDVIPYNYFDEKYNDYLISEFKELIITKGVYKIEHKHISIYFRAVKLSITIKIIDSNTSKSISFPLGLMSNSYTQLISNIENEIHQPIDTSIYIFQDTEYLDEISKEEDLKRYSKTGLILYLFPIQAQFIRESTGQKLNLLLKFNKPLSQYLPELSQKLNIPNNTRCAFQIKKMMVLLNKLILKFLFTKF